MSTSGWLDWMEGLMGGKSRYNYAAVFPPDQFYCLLEELPLHLVPRRTLALLRTADRHAGEVIVNPECVFTRGDELPAGIERSCVERFALQGTIAWVRNTAANTVLPFWLGPSFEAKLAGARVGDPAPASLSQADCSLLLSAGILVTERQIASQSCSCSESWSRARTLYQQKGYAPLTGLIHPFHVAALRRYYRYLIRTGLIRLGDGQSSRRYVAHNEPVARFFHSQITATISAIAGTPLKPSYVYLASYLDGAELKKHTDREQCEFSVTFCLDFSPEPDFETPWPIRLDTQSGTVSVYQALGDGLAYRGTQLPHYRDVLGEGQTSTSIFFHYVSSDFEGSLS